MLQEEGQSEDQEIAEDEENDFILESESMLQSYCSRMDTNNQTFSGQVDSGQPRNEESPVSQESSCFNPKLLQCLVGHVQAYRFLWNKASPEYKLGQKKKLAWINIGSNLGIDGKSIKKSVEGLRYFMRWIDILHTLIFVVPMSVTGYASDLVGYLYFRFVCRIVFIL